MVYTRGDQWCTEDVINKWRDTRRIDLSHVPHAFPCKAKDDEEVLKTLIEIFNGDGDWSTSTNILNYMQSKL